MKYCKKPKFGVYLDLVKILYSRGYRSFYSGTEKKNTHILRHLLPPLIAQLQLLTRQYMSYFHLRGLNL